MYSTVCKLVNAIVCVRVCKRDCVAGLWKKKIEKRENGRRNRDNYDQSVCNRQTEKARVCVCVSQRTRAELADVIMCSLWPQPLAVLIRQNSGLQSLQRG